MKDFVLVLTFLCLSAQALADAYTEFRETIRNGDVEHFQQIAPAEEDIRASAYNRGIDALTLAVGFDSLDIVKDILRRFPDYSAENAPEAMLLACSANRKNQEAIEIFLSSGITIDAKSRNGQNCLYSAVLQADYDFFDYLIGKGASVKTSIKPDPIFGYSSLITIEAFIADRLDTYREMQNRITSDCDKNQPHTHAINS
ncbi:MAG: ankyrin repeat domain-containing protein, partial [Cellvibrionaceae bacterium]